MRIEQPIDPTLGDCADLSGGDGQEIRCKGKRFTVKVAGRLDLARLEDDRVVDCGRQLDGGDAPGEIKRISRRAGDLRTAANGVRILHGVLRVPM